MIFTFEILRYDESPSTSDVEIFPGKCWEDRNLQNTIFIDEDDFIYAISNILKHYRNYDTWGENAIHRSVGFRIISDWRDIGNKLLELTPKEAKSSFGIDFSYYERKDKLKEGSYKDLIAKMLLRLSLDCESMYLNNEWICICGP